MSQDSNSKKPWFIVRIGRGVQERVASARSAAAETIRDVADRTARKVEGPKASYQGAAAPIELQLDVVGGTMWATQHQMADLFGVNQPAIAKHIQNIFETNELQDDEATHSKMELVRDEGGRQVAREVEHYSLDMIIAVGYRVSSRQATEFRRWATDKLSAYVREGYVLNERRLRDDPDALQSLVEKVRALRVEEKNLYARVRDCFKLTASDYDPQSDEARRFYAALQEKFTYAASEHTTAELILARADGSKAMMGMSSYLGDKPTLAEARKGKNYLLEEELHYLRLVADAFLIFVEGKAMKGKKLTMAELLVKMDKILEFNEMPVFPGYRNGYQRDRADAYAKAQYELFKSRTTQERYAAARRLPSS
ncbi:RhuM family protein [Methylobacterium brachiatum]|uniref:RhuM family protein n=1 Tax=Methylobacterium brachiatum TaxID=269660 RepID=UPI0013CE7B24|nr:RhuM family protein [Methylobacterium brachiatum]MDH2310322.1 RhuM family protein [Methylobacterium brachiatum]